MTTNLLPVGTYVHVSPTGQHPWVGRVVGYDMGHTKYEIGVRYGGWGEWLFLDGGSWAVPREVEEIGEAEALLVPDEEVAS